MKIDVTFMRASEYLKVAKELSKTLPVQSCYGDLLNRSGVSLFANTSFTLK